MNLEDLNPLGAIMDVGSKLIDHFFPDPKAKAAAQLELLKLQQSGELADLDAYKALSQAQMQINQQEAGAAAGIKNAFVAFFIAGWRPAVGWTCVLAFLYTFVAEPLLMFAMAALGHPLNLPQLDIGALMPVLLGILGIGGYRTLEKIRGVNQQHG